MTETMRAVVKDQKLGYGARLERVDLPRPGPGEVLVRIEKAAICGSDKLRYRWGPGSGPPDFLPRLIMGHEAAGRVVGLGPGVSGLEKGRKVALETHLTCGACLQCRTGQSHVCHNLKVLGVHRDGCFAEYIALPRECAVPLPEEIPLTQAVLLEPLGVAYHALSKVRVAANPALVLGCGPIGLMAVHLARALGAAPILAVAKHPLQAKLARDKGADLVLSPDPAEIKAAVAEATDGYGVGAALELTGTREGVLAAFEAVRKAGELVLVGTMRPLEFDFQRFLNRKELTVHGLHGRRLFETWTGLLDLLRAGRLDLSGLVTADLPLESFEEAFALADQKDQVKVLLSP